jgi:hypothetical protein
MSICRNRNSSCVTPAVAAADAYPSELTPLSHVGSHVLSWLSIHGPALGRSSQPYTLEPEPFRELPHGVNGVVVPPPKCAVDVFAALKAIVNLPGGRL